MAAVGISTRKILQGGYTSLAPLLQQLIVNNEGDLEVSQQVFTAIASASTTGAASFSPPQDQTDIEYILVGVQVRDTASIDAADRVCMVYIDDKASYVFQFFDQKGSLNDTIRQNVWTWPQSINPPAPTTSDVCADYIPFRLFRSVNGEAWRRLRLDLLTTATVGTRTFQLTVVYRRRPSTRI